MPLLALVVLAPRGGGGSNNTDTLTTNRRDTRPQNISRQIARRPDEAVRNANPGVGEGMKL